MKSLVTSLFLVFLTVATRGQGTFVYDQESSADEVSPFGSVPIQAYGTVGQSFTPSLATVGFVRLRQFDINPGNALGATLVVNLRSSAINGPIIGTTTPVVLTNGFAGAVNFYFGSAVPVTPTVTYFLEALVQSGDNWGITTIPDSYPNGSFYSGGSGFPFPGSDLWFREGIVVPEPSAVALFLGGGVFTWLIRKKQQRS